MFQARITETWDAAAGITERYLLQQQVELTGGTVLLQGRVRETGQRHWLLAATTEEAYSTIRAQADAFALAHTPGLAGLEDSQTEDEPPWLALEWRGEVRLSQPLLGQLAPIDRLRMAQALVELVDYLAAAGRRIALGSLELSGLWFTPALRQLRMLYLPGCEVGADDGQLAQSRQLAWQVTRDLIGGELEQLGAETNLKEACSNWCGGKAGLDAPAQEFARLALALVTADL